MIFCYESCSYYYYFDSEYNFHCTNNLSCPDEYPSLNQDKNECIKEDKNIYSSSILEKNLIEIIETQKNVEFIFTSEIYGTTKLDNRKDLSNKNGYIFINNIIIKKKI